MNGKKESNVYGRSYYKKFKQHLLNPLFILSFDSDKMNDTVKTIRDPIHGDIEFKGLFLDLLEAPEIQRLHNIKQLGFAHLVFPGGHHTRLEHSFGAYYMAGHAAEHLNLDSEEKELVSCAAILHDIGHGPFSHTLESILRNTLNVDHVDLTEKLILGEHAIFDHLEKEFIDHLTVFDVLNKYGMDHKKIADIIKGSVSSKKYLSQLLDSAIDVDQLDYLIRDAYYTGVAYGMIDYNRFIQTLTISNDNLAVEKKGVGVIENILMARTLMYSSVYFHKTVRIAELMLSKAIELVENADPFEIFKLTDGEMINELKKMGDLQREIATRLKYRKLYKKAYSIGLSDLGENQMEIIKKLDNFEFRRQKEIEFEEKLNIPSGKIIIDVPQTELHLSEPRIDKTEIQIVDGVNPHMFDEYTPVGSAVRSKSIPEWILMIITDEKYRETISENAEKILFK